TLIWLSRIPLPGSMAIKLDCQFSVFYRKFRECLPILRRQVFLLTFVIDLDHEDPVDFGNIQIDHACPTTFTLSAPGISHTQFSEPSRSLDHFPRLGAA